jgi:folate-dependent phosphoribosylglycinamide formyltransferase PurN
MNLVILCKSWNHKKVLEILEALREQELRVRGIVTLAASPKRPTFSEIIRKTHERGVAQTIARFFSNHRDHHDRMNGFIAVKGVDPTVGIHSQNGRLHFDNESPPHQTIAEYAQQQQIEMTVVQDLNSEACAAALRRMNTDILLLGGAPIIRANILAVPKICTLNVHMALLPEFRGMNVAEWSIFSGAPVGVTVHQVDPGVDTGAILYREEIDVSDCSSIAALRKKVSRQQHLVLAKCTRLLIEKKLTPAPQNKTAGKQYYLMHEKLKKVVEHKLSLGYTRNARHKEKNSERLSLESEPPAD